LILWKKLSKRNASCSFFNTQGDLSYIRVNFNIHSSFIQEERDFRHSGQVVTTEIFALPLTYWKDG